MNRRKSLGLDRRVDLEWLDTTAAQVASGSKVPKIRSALFELLEGRISGGSKPGTACHKTVGVLSRAWVTVVPEVTGLRDRAVKLLPSLTPRERLALHWSLLTASYPFFGDLARSTGRLLALQGDLTLSQLTQRMRETWGDRSTMKRATQRVVRSMVQWGTLSDTKEKGVYTRALKPVRVDGELAELLLEGLLIYEAKAIPVDQAIRHPGLFPFEILMPSHRLRKSPRFEVHRQGLDVDVVALVGS